MNRRAHATIFLALATGAVGCSLGLDASLMQTGLGDAGTGEAGEASAGSTDAGGEAQSPVSMSTGAAVTSCTSDADCASAGSGAACVTGSRCDPTWHVCMLDVCNVGACAVASCDILSKQCQTPTSMDFAISLFAVVAGGVGGTTPASSIAAAYPFLFVLTTNGVVAYNVANPTTNVPPMVAVHGIPFIPLALASVGRRVYFVSDVLGSGPTYRQAVAWLDVPGDPFLASLDANEAWIGVAQGTATPALDSALAAPSGRLELVYTGTHPLVASLLPPLADSTVLVPAGIASISDGAAIVATSGTDLVTYRYGTSSLHPIFSVVSGADQSSGQATPERNFGSYGPTDPSANFAGGNDGTVLWESAPLAPADAGGGIASARLTWLSPITDGGLFDFSVHADVERYSSSSMPTDAVGPVAWLDANTALVLAAARESTDTTSAQVFDRTRGAVVPGIRAIISAPPSSLGVAVSQGFAYVLAQDDPNNARATVYVLAPGCGTPTTTTAATDAGPPPGDAGAGGDAASRGDGGGVGSKPSFVTLAP
jgi:hypothetical protein